MNDPTLLPLALTQWIYAQLLRFERLADDRRIGSDPMASRSIGRGESGAVSLEQVLWFVAAGVSVAAVSAIMWNQIRTRANTTISVPVAP